MPHVALASGSCGNDRIRSVEKSSAHNHARKVMVGVAAVRLRLWLCLWVWLRYILKPRQ